MAETGGKGMTVRDLYFVMLALITVMCFANSFTLQVSSLFSVAVTLLPLIVGVGVVIILDTYLGWEWEGRT